MKEALFYKKLKDKAVQCQLCPHFCTIKPKERGRCGVRGNRGGTLYSLVYGKAISTAVDPIEKKPLFHFMPGTMSFSIATVGCNFSCLFCQNWEISQIPKQASIFGEDILPKQVVDDAVQKGCKSIAYTYTEPTIFFEYAYDTAKLANKKGLKNIFVTNGFINKEPVDMIEPYLDAANIDLKGFSEEYYKTVIGGRLKPILDTIKYMHKLGIWIELTTLIVPGHNDNPAMLKKIVDFIAGLDKEIPWHISRFYPNYKMTDVPPTDIKILKKAHDIGKKAGIKYIYIGNVPGNDYESTYCSKCKKKVMARAGFSVYDADMKQGKCAFCKNKIPGVF
ncbi:AmmeMemoRadiSam system radical SAM enzyme [Candidatus Woesearchaeota archaeon]|nr:AmmeMemoRadiSam system radical SAM enzyme [Candidatus Woesearchaeota archaeon]